MTTEDEYYSELKEHLKNEYNYTDVIEKEKLSNGEICFKINGSHWTTQLMVEVLRETVDYMSQFDDTGKFKILFTLL